MIDAYFSKREVYRNREILQLFDFVDCKAVCKKIEKTICLQIDGCLSGPSQRMHEARSQKLCFVAREILHDDHRNLSILCPIYAQYKGEAVSYVLNITLTKRWWLLSVIFVNHHALTNIDIKPGGRGH